MACPFERRQTHESLEKEEETRRRRRSEKKSIDGNTQENQLISSRWRSIVFFISNAHEYSFSRLSKNIEAVIA